jgi:glycosyltransferase involved in cell wall biosynthesis
MPSLDAALIVPALNEADNLPALLDAPGIDLFRWVLVADNGSTDQTALVARSHGALVVSEPERGYGAASLKAIAALPPEARIVVWIQADLSEDPAEAAKLLGNRLAGLASRGSLLPHQVFGSWLACFLIRLFWGHRYHDLGAFRAIRRDALDQLHMADRNFGWTVEMQIKALQHGLRVLEVPVSYKPRHAGQNKVSGNLKASLRAGWIILKTVFQLRFTS